MEKGQMGGHGTKNGNKHEVMGIGERLQLKGRRY